MIAAGRNPAGFFHLQPICKSQGLYRAEVCKRRIRYPKNLSAMTTTDRKNLRVLVLDDDPDIGTMIRAMLNLRGYDVAVTESAQGMFDYLSQGSVHLILSDMLLSGDDGTDICLKLKADPATSEIPVIMFSAHPNARELCLKAGADAFIGKPFDLKELYATVDEMAMKLPR